MKRSTNALRGTIGVVGLAVTACMPSDPPTTTTTTGVPFNPVTIRMSLGPGSAQLGSGAFQLAINDDGRWLAFTTEDALQAEDTNGLAGVDVYVRDTIDGSVRLMAPTVLAPAFGEPNGGSTQPSLDASGARVAYESIADNLVFNDANGSSDVFSTSVLAAVPEATSLGIDTFPYVTGAGYSDDPVLSGDGRFVAYSSNAADLVTDDTNGIRDAFVRDLWGAASERVSVSTSGAQANGSSAAEAISLDGRFVTFRSFADNLVTGDTNGQPDVFLRDRVLGTTTRISLDNAGSQFGGQSVGSQVSDDGRYVAFIAQSVVGGPTAVYRRDRVTGQVQLVSVGPDGSPTHAAAAASMSRDGRYIAFAATVGDWFTTPAYAYARDMNGTNATLVSADGAGAPTAISAFGSRQLQISGDGRVVAFLTLVPIAVNDTNGVSDVYYRRWRP